MECNELNNKMVVYTGSFCPPTKAHFELMINAMKAVGASHGCFLPTCYENIKSKMITKMDRLALSNEVRIKMLESFCKDYPDLEVSDYEMKINDSNNTYKTFCHLQEVYSNYKLYYVMGADKLHNLPHWKNIDSFLDKFNFIVFDRSDIDAKSVIENSLLFNKYKDHFIVVDGLNDLSDVSSSKVREMFLNKNDEYKKYVTSDVSDILENIDLNDYPEVNVYDYISLKLKSGPHGVTAACRKVYLMNKEIFKTFDIKEMLDNIKIYDDVSSINRIKKYNTNLVILEKEYYELAKEYDNLAIIVESSKNRAGGNYDQGGSDTLEEELCKVSTLSQALYKYGNEKLKCVRESKVNERSIYPLNNILYVPNVNLIRYSKINNYRLLPFNDIRLNMIMVPSLNLKRNDKINDINLQVDGRLNSDGINIMKERLRKALLIALDNNIENIIINAFGNGFKVDYKDSALILNDVLNEFNGCFKNIIINDKQRGKIVREFYSNLKVGD